MTNIPFPRLLDPTTMQETRRITPISASVNLNITPLSTATLVVDIDEDIPVRSWIEMYTANGSAGIYRVREITAEYGETPTKTLQLEHGACIFADVIRTNTQEKEFLVGPMIVRATWTTQQPLDDAPNALLIPWEYGSTGDAYSEKFIVIGGVNTYLSVLTDMLEQIPNYMMTFNQSVFPWQISIEKIPTVVSAEGRLTRNVNSARITIDSSELYNRSVAYRNNDGDDVPTTWIKTDAESCELYGCTRYYFQVDDGLTDAQINKMANTYLQRYKNPSYSVEIDGYDLSNITGESIDSFEIGKRYRLTLPDYGVTIERNITNLAWSDVYGDPNHVSITLEERPSKIVNFIYKNSKNKVEKKKG